MVIFAYQGCVPETKVSGRTDKQLNVERNSGEIILFVYLMISSPI
jgi:hypothetical protein